MNRKREVSITRGFVRNYLTKGPWEWTLSVTLNPIVTYFTKHTYPTTPVLF